MNYRHAFHAGNFADLVKHAALTQLLERVLAQGARRAPLRVIDTHAGRGVYDLAGEEARRSGEAAQGVARLMAADDAPPVFASLKQAVRRLNGSGTLRRYPGSPWLIAQALRPDDRYLACELRPEEHAALRRTLSGRANVETRCQDGYALAARAAAGPRPELVLIDPPFERGDDHARTVRTLSAVRRRNAQAVALAWLPLKDLETFDGFLRDLEDSVGQALIAETRMRPLDDPLRMNGCALAVLGPPDGLAPALHDACAWIAGTLGLKGVARVYAL